MRHRFATALVFCTLMLLAGRNALCREDYGALLEKDCEVCHIDRYYPGGSFIDAEEGYKWKIFWICTALGVLIFTVGMANNIMLWRLGKGSSLRGKLQWGPVLRAVLTEVILERRIFRASILRWFVFFGISMGFIFLTVPYLAYWVLRLSSGLNLMEPSPFELTLNFLLDFFNLFIVIGVILALIRRYVVKSPQLENLIQDTAAVLLIFLIVLSGFLLEGFRCAVLPAGPALSVSFVGAAIGSWLRPVELPWTVIHFYLWLVHGVLSLAFVAYIPFGKIRHFIACPVSIAATASDEAHAALKH